MNYCIYFILVLLLAHSVGLSGMGLDKERIQKLFGMMQSHVGECMKVRNPYPLYKCPSHLWPNLVHNFVPTIGLMEGWIKQRIGAGADIWIPMLKRTRGKITNYNQRDLCEIRDEVTTWLLLNRYLTFDPSGYYVFQWRCIAEALNRLTALDLERVSMLSYG